jgi:hypothetical protein
MPGEHAQMAPNARRRLRRNGATFFNGFVAVPQQFLSHGGGHLSRPDKFHLSKNMLPFGLKMCRYSFGQSLSPLRGPVSFGASISSSSSCTSPWSLGNVASCTASLSVTWNYHHIEEPIETYMRKMNALHCKRFDSNSRIENS